nr:MAG TPA: hypothetical protein [Caudoviricetes sp.]
MQVLALQTLWKSYIVDISSLSWCEPYQNQRSLSWYPIFELSETSKPKR